MYRIIHSFFDTLRTKSVQFIITISFALIVVVMLFVGFVLYNKFSHSAVVSTNLNTEQIIELMKFDLEDYLAGMTASFNQIENRFMINSDVESFKLMGQLGTISSTREDIVSISLFSTEGELVTSLPKEEMRSNTNLGEQSWFKSAIESTDHISFSSPHIQNLFKGSYKWVVSMSKRVTYYRNNVQMSGVLLMDVNFKKINDLCKRVKLGKRGYVYIIDESAGNIIYHPQQQLIFNGLKYENVEQALKFTYGNYEDRESNGEYRLNTVKTLDNVGWKIIGVTYKNEIITTNKEIRTFIMWILISVIIFLLLISGFMSARISQPIRRLKKSMERVEKGDFEFSIHVRGGGEIELLSRRYNLMVERIRQLMDQIILEQEAKRKYELEVLQAQINPHFLYNTLNSAVRMVSIGKNEDVITTITSLSKLFRISLSSGNNFITIAEEIEHIRHYLIIQKMRYKHKFEYEIDVEEKALHCKTLKLILQPIVENSIFHGIEQMVDTGHIRISVSIVDHRILFQISDTGLGMPQHILDTIISGRAKQQGRGSGVGVYNVQERIRLYYGEEYGLQFESELEVGTTVRVWIPQIIEAGEE